MENLNFHKQKLFSLILAGVAFISLLLPWMSVSINLGGFGMAGGTSANGFRGWGFLTLLGVAAVAAAAFLGDKAKEYDNNMKIVALAGFAAIAVGAIVFFIRIKSVGSGGYRGVSSSASFGLWLALIVGLAGIALVLGLVKLPDLNKASTTPPPPPPPPPTTPTV